MYFVELGQAVWAHATHAVDVLAAVTGKLAPTPDPQPSDINTNGLISFFASKIAPILLAVLGVIFIGRASKGEVSKVLTSSAIAIIGLAFIAGALSLFFVGDYLISLAFKQVTHAAAHGRRHISGPAGLPRATRVHPAGPAALRAVRAVRPP